MRELLLVDINGSPFAIWKDETLTQENQVIHWLTSSPAALGAIIILNHQTVSLADLSFCLGGEPCRREKENLVLILSEEDRVAGFVVQGDTSLLRVEQDAVFPIPAWLQTEVINSCVLSGTKLIPLVNLQTLHRLVHKVNFEPVAPHLYLAGSVQQGRESLSKNVTEDQPEDVRLFAAGDKPFALPARIVAPGMAQLGPLTSLPLTPDYVRGVTLHEHRILPMVDLSHRMKQTPDRVQNKILIAEAARQEFALLVESDIGVLSKADYALKPLPQLARSDWLRNAAVRGRRTVPIIDLARLLTGIPGLPSLPLADSFFSPESTFPDQFGREEIEIVEFSLLGGRHALPRSEVVDIFTSIPSYPVPDAWDMVAGIALYKGEMIPVLDLARCFGIQSKPDENWQMLLVRNGDFQVLVLAEKVSGERKLTIDMQRQLPFVSPQQVIYGCYPDGNTVRLILNVHSLTLHFDRERAREFFDVFADYSQEAAPVLSSPAPVAKPVAEPLTAKEIYGYGGYQEVESIKLIIEEHEELPQDDPVFSQEPRPSDLKSDSDTFPELDTLLDSVVFSPEPVIEPLAREKFAGHGEYLMVQTGELVIDEPPLDEPVVTAEPRPVVQEHDVQKRDIDPLSELDGLEDASDSFLKTIAKKNNAPEKDGGIKQPEHEPLPQLDTFLASVQDLLEVDSQKLEGEEEAQVEKLISEQRTDFTEYEEVASEEIDQIIEAPEEIASEEVEQFIEVPEEIASEEVDQFIEAPEEIASEEVDQFIEVPEEVIVAELTEKTKQTEEAKETDEADKGTLPDDGADPDMLAILEEIEAEERVQPPAPKKRVNYLFLALLLLGLLLVALYFWQRSFSEVPQNEQIPVPVKVEKPLSDATPPVEQSKESVKEEKTSEPSEAQEESDEGREAVEVVKEAAGKATAIVTDTEPETVTELVVVPEPVTLEPVVLEPVVLEPVALEPVAPEPVVLPTNQKIEAQPTVEKNTVAAAFESEPQQNHTQVVIADVISIPVVAENPQPVPLQQVEETVPALSLAPVMEDNTMTGVSDSPDPKQAPQHVVNKGDTLWAISEDYTGSGYNYHRLARDNKINDPDLIYPDQTVKLNLKNEKNEKQ